jgi:hypothetical protein
MSADSETASYTSATAFSDNDRQPCPVRRRLHDTRSADDRFGRLRSPVTNSGGVKSQRAEANRRVGTTVAVANVSQGTLENCLPSSIRRHANRTVVDRSRRNRSSARSGRRSFQRLREVHAGPLFIGVLRHQPATTSVNADTAAAHSACDIGTRTGSTTVIDAVRETCPPRSPLTMNCSTTRRPPGYALNGLCPPGSRWARAMSSSPLRTVVPAPAHLRMRGATTHTGPSITA